MRRASGARPRPFLVFNSNNCTGHHPASTPETTSQNTGGAAANLVSEETIFQKGQASRTGMGLAGTAMWACLHHISGRKRGKAEGGALRTGEVTSGQRMTRDDWGRFE